MCWFVALNDLDTSKDYVRQRITDHFVDLLSIGFSGFRIDPAKQVGTDDRAVIFATLKSEMGGELPKQFSGSRGSRSR
jgi:alpha-amylase